MDLVSPLPIFNLYNRQWPILTNPPSLPPAKFSERGIAFDSVVGAGSIISGGELRRTVASYDVYAGRDSVVENSVLMPSVKIGENAKIKNARLEKALPSHVDLPSSQNRVQNRDAVDSAQVKVDSHSIT
jgi:glucose-1-phosphate adenylyltransferase